MLAARFRFTLRSALTVVAIVALLCTVALQARRIRQLEARYQAMEARAQAEADRAQAIHEFLRAQIVAAESDTATVRDVLAQAAAESPNTPPDGQSPVRDAIEKARQMGERDAEGPPAETQP